VGDPDDPTVLSDIEFLLDTQIPQLRVNLPKEHPIIEQRKDDYISLFKRIADLVYMSGKKPLKFGWDNAMRSNAHKKAIGEPLLATSSSYCGAGFNYLAVDNKGDIYPCDYFADYPEFRIGNVETGFSDEARVFKDVKDWHTQIYSFCGDCKLGDIRLCPNPMCYAENFRINGNILKPTHNACTLREIEFEIYTYVSHLNTKLHGKIQGRDPIDERLITI
jgi:uncharacterized protein